MARIGSLGALVSIELDRNGDTPIHEQISAVFRQAVTSGRLQRGTRLPSTRALARDWGVSRNTVLHVFETLTAEGLLDSRVGAGTFVTTDETEDISEGYVQEPGERLPVASESYPFRRLSARGRNLVTQNPGALTETPTPFMPDVPDITSFPMRSWLRLMNEVTGRLKGNILVNVTNAGYEPLREAIVHHLRVTRKVDCQADQVIITTGSQQSLDLVTRLLLERGDPVWIEEPGYIGTRATLAANGCTVYPVEADQNGMNFEKGRKSFPAPRMIVTSPARHYPLGGRMSSERRGQMLSFSSSSGAWILEDDYDCEFFYKGGIRPAIKSQDADDRVIMIGTFSKTLLPSFRLGYVVAPKDLALDFARARAVIDRHAPILEQMVLAEFMHRGLYAAHLRRMRELYHARQICMAHVLDRFLGYTPPAAEFESGMHFILPLQMSANDRQVSLDLWEQKTTARALSIYYSSKRRRKGLLLGFAAYDEEKILAHGPKLKSISDLVDGSTHPFADNF